MRRYLPFAAVLVSCVAATPAAGATGSLRSALVLSPRVVSFGDTLRPGETRVATVTVSNRGTDALLLRRRSIGNAAIGCRAFGRRCPVRIVPVPGRCPASGALFGGTHCQIALEFQPLTTGPLSISLCVYALGPMGAIAPPTTRHVCVPIHARVLPALTSSRTSPQQSLRTPSPGQTITTRTAPAATLPPQTSASSRNGATGAGSSIRSCATTYYPGPSVALTTSAGAAFVPSSFDFGSVPICQAGELRLTIITVDATGISFVVGTSVEVLSRPPSSKPYEWSRDWANLGLALSAGETLPPAGTTTNCGGYGTFPKPFEIYPTPPCHIWVYFHPTDIGAFTVQQCNQYTRNEDPAPKPVHQVCFTLTGVGIPNNGLTSLP